MSKITHTATSTLALVAAATILTACTGGAEVDTMEGYVSQSIGLATTSSDGIKFDKQRQVLMQSEKHRPEKEFVGNSTPSALAYDGKIHLICDEDRELA